MSAMLTLTAAQRDGLQAIQRTRHLARLAAALAQSFPDVPGRLGERYPKLIEHGAVQAARHGIVHGAAVARYLACWFALGAEFESKPGFEWALQLLKASPRSEAAKAFQLSRQTLETLQQRALQPAAGAGSVSMPPAQFAEALQVLDTAMRWSGTLGSLHTPQALDLGTACDIDTIDLRPAAVGTAEAYRFEHGEWLRTALPAMPMSWTGTAEGIATHPMPAQLHVVASPGHAEATRLRLRTRAAACCDPALHPLVRHTSRAGCAQWRGAHAADLSLELQLPADGAGSAASDAPPRPAGPTPVMAAETGAELSVLSLSACGLRDKGQPLGECSTRLAVYPGEQHLVAWRREPSPRLQWPAVGASPAAAPAAPTARVERNGMPLNATAWQAGLADLDRQLATGLGRLAQAWERDSGVTEASMQAEPQVMCGRAGLSWGWAASASGWAQPPVLRIAGMFDLVACRLHLRLAGTLRLHGSISRLSLDCLAVHPLRAGFERGPEAAATGADLLAALAPARCQASQPFTLALQAIADSEASFLDVASPVMGSLEIDCGLRQRPQGHGLQWYAKISLQPLAVRLRLHDPLLGSRSLQHPLLPALNLLDWSLG